MTVILPALLAVAFAARSTEARTCYYDAYGRYRCSALSNAARVGIGIGCAVLALFVLSIITMMRRRRIQTANKAYATAFQNQQQQQYQQQPFQPGMHPQHSSYGGPFTAQQTGANWNASNTQYPPNTYQHDAQLGGGYKPPGGPPPGSHSGGAGFTNRYEPPSTEAPPGYNTQFVPPSGPPPNLKAEHAV